MHKIKKIIIKEYIIIVIITVRILYISICITNYDIDVLDEKFNKESLDNVTLNQLITRSKSSKNEIQYNPLNVDDYVKMFFGTMQYEPSITVIKMAEEYRVCFHGYKSSYISNYVFDKSMMLKRSYVLIQDFL